MQVIQVLFKYCINGVYRHCRHSIIHNRKKTNPPDQSAVHMCLFIIARGQKGQQIIHQCKTIAGRTEIPKLDRNDNNDCGYGNFHVILWDHHYFFSPLFLLA